jgi:hypothetical protein
MKLFVVLFDFQEQLSAALLCMLQFGHDFIGWGVGVINIISGFDEAERAHSYVYTDFSSPPGIAPWSQS